MAIKLEDCEIKAYAEYTMRGDEYFIAELSHIHLGTFRRIRDKDKAILDHKASSQLNKWCDLWEKMEN